MAFDGFQNMDSMIKILNIKIKIKRNNFKKERKKEREIIQQGILKMKLN